MRKDIRLLIIGLLMFMFFSIVFCPQISVKGYSGPPGMDDIFGDKNTRKDRWQDAFNHTHHQDWHNWTENWQNKYNNTSNGFKEKWRNVLGKCSNYSRN